MNLKLKYDDKKSELVIDGSVIEIKLVINQLSQGKYFLKNESKRLTKQNVRVTDTELNFMTDEFNKFIKESEEEKNISSSGQENISSDDEEKKEVSGKRRGPRSERSDMGRDIDNLLDMHNKLF